MKNISTKTQIEIAMQLVIMDAIEKGHTNANEIATYMKSKQFVEATQNYLSLMNA